MNELQETLFRKTRARVGAQKGFLRQRRQLHMEPGCSDKLGVLPPMVPIEAGLVVVRGGGNRYVWGSRLNREALVVPPGPKAHATPYRIRFSSLSGCNRCLAPGPPR
jgi:hypothetical protein